MSFLKDDGLLTEEKKGLILQNIEEVYIMTTNTHGNKKMNRDDYSDTDLIVTNSNSNHIEPYHTKLICVAYANHGHKWLGASHS